MMILTVFNMTETIFKSMVLKQQFSMQVFYSSHLVECKCCVVLVGLWRKK